MKHYLVTYFPEGDLDAMERVGRLLKAHYEFITQEFDAGLFFIRSEGSAQHILDHLTSAIELPMAHTLYVLEITGDWDGAGTVDAMRALGSSLLRAN